MTKWDSDALSAPHSQREIGMIEDGKKAGDPVMPQITVPPIMHSFEDTTHAYECGYQDGYRAAQPTAEVERLQEMLEGKFNLIESAVVNEWKVRAEKAQAALAAMTENAKALAMALQDATQGWTDLCDQALAAHNKLMEGE